jgi:hypothetical protein
MRLLRQTCRVLGHDGFALKVRRHPENLSDRDHPCPANAGHHDPEGLITPGQSRLRQVLRRIDRVVRGSLMGSRRFRNVRLEAPLHCDEARTKPLDAAFILVATAQVDLALAPELGFEGLDRKAVALH